MNFYYLAILDYKLRNNIHGLHQEPFYIGSGPRGGKTTIGNSGPSTITTDAEWKLVIPEEMKEDREALPHPLTSAQLVTIVHRV